MKLTKKQKYYMEKIPGNWELEPSNTIYNYRVYYLIFDYVKGYDESFTYRHKYIFICSHNGKLKLVLDDYKYQNLLSNKKFDELFVALNKEYKKCQKLKNFK